MCSHNSLGGTRICLYDSSKLRSESGATCGRFDGAKTQARTLRAFTNCSAVEPNAMGGQPEMAEIESTIVPYLTIFVAITRDRLYLAFWSLAVGCCSSASRQLELGLYSFMDLARASVFLPRSFS